MGMQPANHKRLFECDACGAQMDGWSKKELIDVEKWSFHKFGSKINANSDFFVLCDSCTLRYSAVWEAKAAA